MLISLGCVSTRMFRSWPACSMRFAKARGAASQPPGCWSLATANLPRSICRRVPCQRPVSGMRSFSLNSRLVA